MNPLPDDDDLDEEIEDERIFDEIDVIDPEEAFESEGLCPFCMIGVEIDMRNEKGRKWLKTKVYDLGTQQEHRCKALLEARRLHRQGEALDSLLRKIRGGDMMSRGKRLPGSFGSAS